MNHKQVELVQASWKKVLAHADTVAQLFCARLVALDPSLRPMLETRQLVAMISVAVSGLARIETLVPVCEALSRHRPATAAEALLWTLEQCLGRSFTPETKGAWLEAFCRLEAKAA